MASCQVHPLDGKLHVQADGFLTDIFHQLFIHFDHIVYIHKGQLHIHLGEFRLSVRSQILITEASCDLEIPVIAGTHQQLLENLRRLGQRVKHSRDAHGWAPDSPWPLPAWTW